jgi:hypothetical protein
MGAMLSGEVENCLLSPASLEAGARDTERPDRKWSTGRDLLDARVEELVREEVAACLRILLGPTDMSPKGEGRESYMTRESGYRS